VDLGTYPPGYCHFPKYSEEYFKQLTAEQFVTRVVKGYRRGEWQKTRDRNEALDCRVYARAAASVYGMDLGSSADWDRLCARLEELVRQAKAPENVVPRRKTEEKRPRVIYSPYLNNDWS
jgi:phage terminase large subunit GpA-like protein